ncbi:hypothetical protein ACFY8S_01480 [Streptomyces hygroscopicus]|uniref:hypothetical protein n=1 Tax=Streptomyces hygroscopicus TaxID=1912 RepID=UPI00369421A8
MPVEPVPCAPEGGSGTPVELTACCAPSIASTALCRADGTTVLLVVRSGCAECGQAAPDPEVIGWIDAASGTFTQGPGPADAGPCDAGGCYSPSITSAPLCRPDGSTLLVVVRSASAECGQDAGDPALAGWLDLATGTYTPGAPPADAGPCDAGCVDTVCRTRCDDTDGDGQADATFTELWCIRPDGTAELILTYQDDPSTPYTPVAPVDCEHGCPQTETLTLCDDSGPFLRRITWLAGTATYEDTELDGQTPHVPTGTVTVCADTSGDAPCAEQTTPAATLGLCLPDGTPLAVLITRDCDGTVTQDGWLNLTTGQFTSGPPPAGAMACGDSRAFELAGLLCDVAPATGDVLGLVLVEYEYNADGSLASVRLVDPATGVTYTLQGELRHCPAGTGEEQPEQDLTVLCDVQADGTPVPFVRDYRRDAAGQIVGHTDYSLDGQPYTPSGNVGQCGEPCRDSSTTLLCDVAALETVTVLDTVTRTDADGWEVISYTDGGCPPANGPAGTVPFAPYRANVYGGAPAVSIRPDQNLGASGCGITTWNYDTAPVRWVLRKTFNAPEDGTATVAALGFRGDGGARVRINGQDAGLYGQWNQPASNGTAQVPVTAGPNTVEIEVRDVGGPNWVGGRLDMTMNRTQQFMRRTVVDCVTGATVSVTDTTLDGQPYTVTGEVGQCQPVAECCATPPPEMRVDVENDVLCLVDDATGTTIGRVLVERVYDDQTGERVEQRLVDPASGELLEVPPGAHLGQCCEITREAVCVAPLLPTSQRVVSNPGNDTSGRVDPAWTWGLTPSGGRTVYDVTPSPAWTTPLPPGGGWVSLTPTTATSPLPPGAPATYYMVTAFELPDDAVLDATTLKVDTLNADNSVWGYALNDGAETTTAPQTTWFNQPPYTEAEHRISGAVRGTNLLAVRVVESNPPSPGGVLLDVTLTYRVPGTPQYWIVEHRDCGTTTYIDPEGNRYEGGLPDGYMACGGGGGGQAPGECCPDVEPVVLCDVAEDGTSTPFLRHLAYTGGTLTGVADTALDGVTPYTPAGTVGTCDPQNEPCRNTSTLLVCDLPTGGTPDATVTDTNPAPYYPYTTGSPVAGGAQALWDGGTVTVPAASGPQPGTVGTVATLAATLAAPRPACDTGTAHVTVSVHAQQLGPDAGCAATGYLRLFNGASTPVALALVPNNTPVDWSGVLTVEADVPAADLAAGNIAALIALDTWDDSPDACPGSPRKTGWQLSAFTATVVYDQTGCATQFLRTVTVDCETGAVTAVVDTTMDGQPYTPTGQVSQCQGTGGGGACCPETEPCPAHSVIEACRCDDTTGDGTGDTEYIELLAVDCTGALTSVGTYTPDLAAPYTPVAPVPCEGASEGAQPAFGVQAGRVELAAGEVWDAGAVATLQSVTATAHTGTGEITTADGTSTLFQGESATWSTQKEGDALLAGPLTITAVTGIVTVTYTRGITLS